MPISMEWVDQEKTLIYTRFEGRLEGSEFLAVEPEFRAMLDGVTHPVDMIVHPIQQIYFSPRYVETTRRLHRAAYPNLRLVVFIGKTMTWELFVTFARRFGRIPYRFTLASSLEEARETIRRFRAEQSLTPPASSIYLN